MGAGILKSLGDKSAGRYLHPLRRDHHRRQRHIGRGGGRHPLRWYWSGLAFVCSGFAVALRATLVARAATRDESGALLALYAIIATVFWWG